MNQTISLYCAIERFYAIVQVGLYKSICDQTVSVNDSTGLRSRRFHATVQSHYISVSVQSDDFFQQISIA